MHPTYEMLPFQLQVVLVSTPNPLAPPIELGSDLAVESPAMHQDRIISFQKTRCQLHRQIAMSFIGFGLKKVQQENCQFFELYMGFCCRFFLVEMALIGTSEASSILGATYG